MKKTRRQTSEIAHWSIEVAGWSGVLLILIAYVLITLKLVTADSTLYQFLNIIGSVFLVVESASKKDNQLTILNAVWAVIALVALSRVLLGL